MKRVSILALGLLGGVACAPQKMEARQPPPEPATQPPVQASPTPATPAPDGAALYAAKCASCHGAKGDGNGPDAMYYSPAPTDFTSAAFAQVPDSQVHEAIAKGKGNMPPFGSKLSPAELDAVAAYVRSFKK